MGIEIRPFEDALWPAMARFLHEHWQANHPLCQKDLFYWQYRGFGPLAGASACRVAVDAGRIVGFLGGIPGLYRLDGEEVPGVALALWVVVQEFRNTGLGILLMREVEKQGRISVCLGVNPTVTRYYIATGYKHLASLHRYVCPLNVDDYVLLLNDPAAANGIASKSQARGHSPSSARADAAAPGDGFVGGPQGRGTPRIENPDAIVASVREWLAQVAAVADGPTEPRPIEPSELAGLWRREQDRWRLALSRTHEFWAWRYRDSIGFQYYWFGEPGQGGLVARLDRIRNADSPGLESKQVLRIIEILPSSEFAGHRPDDGLSRVLGGALQWAQQRGVVAADFQCSSRRLERCLFAAGFRERSQIDPATCLPEVFDPLRRAAAPINLMVKISGRPAIDFDDIYCVKSDGDMDRPVAYGGRAAGEAKSAL